MKTIRIKPTGALIKRFGEIVNENEQSKNKVNKLLQALNDRRNKYVLQGVNIDSITGFDLAVDVVKNIINEKNA